MTATSYYEPLLLRDAEGQILWRANVDKDGSLDDFGESLRQYTPFLDRQDDSDFDSTSSKGREDGNENGFWRAIIFS